MDERTPRSVETREKTARPAPSWVPPTALPEPTPDAGYHFRWVRTATLDRPDNKNVSQRLREGYVPCRREDHPELESLRSDQDSRHPDNIEVGGLMLCKTVVENVEMRTAHYNKQAADQMEAVDNNYLRENDPRMPLMKPERKSRTKFGKGATEG